MPISDSKPEHNDSIEPLEKARSRVLLEHFWNPDSVKTIDPIDQSLLTLVLFELPEGVRSAIYCSSASVLLLVETTVQVVLHKAGGSLGLMDPAR